MISRGRYVWKNSRLFLGVFVILLAFHLYNPYDQIKAILAYLVGLYLLMVVILWIMYNDKFKNR